MALSRVMPVATREMLLIYKKFELTKKDVRKLWAGFVRGNMSMSGEITFPEFCTMVQVRRTKFSEAIFNLVDQDGGGTISFSEYIQALVSFGLFDVDDVLRLCFSMFDEDKSGYLEFEELRHLTKLIAQKIGGNAQKVFNMLDQNGDARVDFGEFQMLNRKYPSLLYPAFQVQVAFQRYSLGEAWFRRRKEKKADATEKKRTERRKNEAERKKKEKKSLKEARKAELKAERDRNRQNRKTGCFSCFRRRNRVQQDLFKNPNLDEDEKFYSTDNNKHQHEGKRQRKVGRGPRSQSVAVFVDKNAVQALSDAEMSKYLKERASLRSVRLAKAKAKSEAVRSKGRMTLESLSV